ncbi:MAG: alpha/beta hydrolase [Panacagrimonas sp.]|nr:alpha/beta hydrolase [Panacagrimonas sp.]MCC2657477.1 alpha/beta hydrolase [Panacagrimonas sp.]
MDGSDSAAQNNGQWQRGDARANGLKLHWEALGPERGAPLLLVMGLGCQLIQWPEPLCRDLAARGFRVIRFDNRDAGLSDEAERGIRFNLRRDFLRIRLGLRPGPANYLLHDMAADTVGLMDALGIDHAHLVGVSMGGMISQIAAGAFPDRVRSLCSIMSSTNHPWLRQTRLDLLLRMATSPPNLLRDTIVARQTETFGLIGSPGFPTPEIERRDFAGRAFDRSFRPGGTLRQMHAIVATGSFEPLLKNVRAPTQIIHGTNDPLVRPACGRRCAALIRDARLELIEGMAHDCPIALMPRWAELIADNAGRAA